MTSITATEPELLEFFEVEPARLEEGEAWPDNDFLYEVGRGDLVLTFAIQPANRDVRIVLKKGGATVYELNAVGVRDVRVVKEKDREFLGVEVSGNEVIRLTWKPEIKITQSYKS